MIQISNLSFAYANSQTDVFNDLSIELPEGRIYGLLGRNGAGKSTLLYLLTGLLFPVKGTVCVDGIDASKRLPQSLSEVFFVPDEFELPQMSMKRYVKTYAPFYPRFSQDILEQCLEGFGLSSDARLDKLSLGQKKKAFVSFAIATQTRLLLMDEPTNGLDIPSKSLFRKMIARHAAEGQTIIIATHQIHDVDALLDHVLIMQEGGQLFNRSLADITAKYAFEYRSVGQSTADALYAEPSVQGNAVVTDNEDGRESTVNLELLFNAVTNGLIH